MAEEAKSLCAFPQMITIQISCDKCGLERHPVQVPARKYAEEDVCGWVKNVVMLAVALEHSRLSPFCQATRMHEVYIPLPEESEFIGQQIE